MKTFSHLWQYLAEFFLELEMFQTNFVDKVKIHILSLIIFFRKSRRLWDNVEKYEATKIADSNMAARCISKTTRTKAQASARDPPTHAHTH